MDKDTHLFKSTSLSDLFEYVYKTSKTKNRELQALLRTVSEMITTPDTAAALMPLFAEVMSTGVRNDEQIVKLSTIAQRLIAAENKTTPEGETIYQLLDEDMKKELLERADRLVEDGQSIEQQLDIIRGKKRSPVDTSPEPVLSGSKLPES